MVSFRKEKTYSSLAVKIGNNPDFSDYEEDKRARLGDDATQPHRIKYRQLTRG